MTIHEHISNLFKQAGEEENFYGMSWDEFFSSRKVSSGWKYQLKKEYKEGRCKLINPYTNASVEAPLWLENFYDEIILISMTNTWTDGSLAVLEMVKTAMIIEDPDAYYALLD